MLIDKKRDYELLKSLYENNSMDLNIDAVKKLRNVVNRSVEFYAGKIIQNPVVVCSNEAAKTSIERVWKWSNFKTQKNFLARSLALYGDAFVKVMVSDKVYFENIDCQYVTDFECDNRGYLKKIRFDIPLIDEEKRPYLYTEYWEKAGEYFSIWESHKNTESTPLEQLGEPKESGFLREFGIDFIPIVYIQFKNVGNKYGSSCVSHALPKIQEANMQADRLSELLFRYNKPVWAVQANATDSSGRPLPAPKFENSSEANNSIDKSIVSLPGTSSMQSLIPNINYNDALAVLNAMMGEIESDLPELQYYKLAQQANLSGKALKLMLGACIDKGNEAQANLLAGLIRLDEIALTLGSNLNIFQNVGKYENGDFEHEINCDELFVTSIDEKASTIKSMTDAGIPLESSLKYVGYTDEEIASVLEAKAREQEQNKVTLASALTTFNQG